MNGERRPLRAARSIMRLYAKAGDMYAYALPSAGFLETCWSRSDSGGAGYYGSEFHLNSGTRRWCVRDLVIPDFQSPMNILG